MCRRSVDQARRVRVDLRRRRRCCPCRPGAARPRCRRPTRWRKRGRRRRRRPISASPEVPRATGCTRWVVTRPFHRSSATCRTSGGVTVSLSDLSAHHGPPFVRGSGCAAGCRLRWPDADGGPPSCRWRRPHRPIGRGGRSSSRRGTSAAPLRLPAPVCRAGPSPVLRRAIGPRPGFSATVAEASMTRPGRTPRGSVAPVDPGEGGEADETEHGQDQHDDAGGIGSQPRDHQRGQDQPGHHDTEHDVERAGGRRARRPGGRGPRGRGPRARRPPTGAASHGRGGRRHRPG